MVTVCIITPAYNAGRFLATTAGSVRRQTFDDWQHIIVDDGSKDDTADIARQLCELDDRVSLVRQTNQGVATARNRGLAAAPHAAEFVLFLDADDVLRPHCLDALTAVLRRDTAAPAAHGSSACIDSAGRQVPHPGRERLGRRYLTRTNAWRLGTNVNVLGDDQPTTVEALALANPVCTPGQVLIRRVALPSSTPFDRAVESCEDWDLWLRLAMRHPLSFVPSVVIDWRTHGDNATGSMRKMRDAERRVRKKFIGDDDVDPALRVLACAGWRAFEGERSCERLELAFEEARRGDWSGSLRDVLRSGSSMGDALRAAAHAGLLRVEGRFRGGGRRV